MKWLYPSLIFILSCQIAWANQKPDSILQEIEMAKGMAKMEMWKDWCENPSKENILSLYNHFHTALKDAERILPKDSALIWSINRQGSIIINLQAFGHGNLGIRVLDEMKLKADSLSLEKGSPHWTLGEWYFYLGYFHYKQVDMVLAEEYLLKAYDIGKQIGNSDLQFNTLTIRGLMKTYLKEYDQAKLIYSRIDSIANQISISEKSKIKVWRNKAYLNGLMGNYNTANESYEKVIDSLHFFSKRYAFRVQTEYASNLCNMGEITRCVDYFEYLRPIFEKEGNDGTMLTFSERYSDALMLAGDYEGAKEWNMNARSFYYDIQEGRRNDEVQEWQTKYETSEKEDTIRQLEQEKLINQFRLVIIALISIVGFGALSFFLYRNRIRQRELSIQLNSNRIISENRDQLFSSITHDIRTPLALMLAPLERAEKHVNNQIAKSDIKMARRNGKRLMELFNQILDWNRAESKTLNLNPQVGHPNLAFDSLTERYKQYAVEKGILFTDNIKVPKGQFLLDYDKLDRVISNLLENAIKFCDTGKGVHLEVHTEVENNEHKLIAKIYDQGPGILPEEEEYLFERFVQGSQGVLKGGTGIGLALVKELVELMNGSIKVSTEIGHGSEFEVVLPIDLISEERIPEIDAKIVTENNISIEDSGKPLILIVEDEPELLAFLRSALIDDYDLTTASSATAGLNIAINRIPDAIISDWMLPDQDGGWFSRQIVKNEMTTHIPILILTAYNSEYYQKEALQSGAVTWMQKPFQLDILKSQLLTILKQQTRVQQYWNKKNSEESADGKVIDKTQAVNPFIDKIQSIIVKNYSDENFSVEKMAEFLLISRVQLFRKVKALTGSSPSKLINEFRLNKARQILQESEFSISEVCYQVGYSDPGYFGKAYKRYFLVSPSQDPTLS